MSPDREGIFEVPPGISDELYLVIQGTPGAVSGQGGTELNNAVVASGCGVNLRMDVHLYRGKGNSGKGPSASRRDSEQFLLRGVCPGPLSFRMVQRDKTGSGGLTLSLVEPVLPPHAGILLLLVLLLLSLPFSVLLVRGGQVPMLSSTLVVYTVMHLLASRGLPPAQPVLPVLGILVSSGLGGGLAGYVVGKVIQRLSVDRARRD